MYSAAFFLSHYLPSYSAFRLSPSISASPRLAMISRLHFVLLALGEKVINHSDRFVLLGVVYALTTDVDFQQRKHRDGQALTYLGATTQPRRRVGTGVVHFSGGALHAEPVSRSVDGVTRGGAVA